LVAPFRQAKSRDRVAATLKDDFHLDAKVDSQPPPPETRKETAVTTETLGTPERRKRSWKFRSWRLQTTVSFYGTSFASSAAPSRSTGYLHHGPVGPPPFLDCYLYILSLSSVTYQVYRDRWLAWCTLARLLGFWPIGTVTVAVVRAIRHGVLRRSVGLSINLSRLRVTVRWSVLGCSHI